MLKTEQEIHNWLNKFNISPYNINDDLSVDVAGSVYLNMVDIETIPIQFGTVLGNFTLRFGKLTSLKGCPIKIRGSFNCSNNNLQTLEFCPQIVGKEFTFKGNKIISLEHAPKTVGTFITWDNDLENFDGFKTEIKNGFVHNCSSLETKLSMFKDFYNEVNERYMKSHAILTPQQFKAVLLKEELGNKLNTKNSSSIKKPKI